MLMLVGEVLPLIPITQTEESANDSRKKVRNRSGKSSQEKIGSNNRI
jgi:hypothetical protein